MLETYLFFAVVLLFIVTIVFPYYLGKRLQFWFQFHLTNFANSLYWFALYFSAFSQIIVLKLHRLINIYIYFIGYKIFGLFFCFTLILMIFDLIYILSNKRFKPNRTTQIAYIISSLFFYLFIYELLISAMMFFPQIAFLIFPIAQILGL